MTIIMETRACGGALGLRCFIMVLIVATLFIVNDAQKSDIYNEDHEDTKNYLSDGLPFDEFYVLKEGETLDSVLKRLYGEDLV
jgi:hypothetical protein